MTLVLDPVAPEVDPLEEIPVQEPDILRTLKAARLKTLKAARALIEVAERIYGIPSIVQVPLGDHSAVPYKGLIDGTQGTILHSAIDFLDKRSLAPVLRRWG